MRRIAARLGAGWLVLGLALVLSTAAEARPAPDRSAVAGPGALGAQVGLVQAVRASRQAVTSGNTIRTNVRKGFIAINAANKKLYACKWGNCTKAGKQLHNSARHWLAVLRPMKGGTKTVARGLGKARTSLGYWEKTGLDAINADAAAKAKKQARFDTWYKRYTANYKLGVKFQNSAVDILSKG